MVFLALALAALPAPIWAQDSAVAVTRSVEADGTTTLVHEVTIPASNADVWRAVSTAQGWMDWAVPIAWGDPATGILETSYNPSAHPGDPGTIVQQFVATIPGRLLAFRTTKAPAGFAAAETYYRVTSVFELEALTGGTRLRLTSVNFAATPEGTQLADFFAEGNASSLDHLRQRFIDGPKDWSATSP
ncbi:MAG: SRPBCC domain-containing protein [Alteraurantiacibacter sp.]